MLFIRNSVGRRAASEGSLLLTVAVRLNSKHTQRGSGGWGYHERAVKGGGVGTGHISKSGEDQEEMTSKATGGSSKSSGREGGD